MTLTRRELGRIAAAVPAASLFAKPNSKIKGVQVGAITYSFRQMTGKADEILKSCVELGISSVELMGDVAESYAGAPSAPGRPGGKRSAMTPEQQEALRKAADDKKKWRLALSMDKYKGLRAMFNDAGVNIAIFKLPITAAMSEEECEYVFSAAKALGANCLTMELPADAALSKRAGELGAKHKVYIGYHNHAQVNENSWDTALAQSSYNTINLDIGHFTEAINGSPIPFIRKHHDRISSFHLKDKKFGSHGGQNAVWGEGETPVKEVLQLMAKEKYKWPANIELEYEIPAGSSVMAEMRKCVQFCKDSLA